jgi:hypothetical protein
VGVRPEGQIIVRGSRRCNTRAQQTGSRESKKERNKEREKERKKEGKKENVAVPKPDLRIRNITGVDAA